MPMKRLEPETMEKILKLAEAMRAQNKDKYRLAHALLYLDERNRMLEDLYHKAERYIRFGMGEHELTDLRLAVERIREADVEDADDSALFVKE
ncbi:MAG TPA: hypothetical protein ENJ98_02205 [Thiolapillus brandeum]|uniref:Uncharacterized protein n=1 Tax=Thiolapillus brandeum TaxID=1076588 RepID=A0A7C5N6F5_9GAMM|nr:hypothetical protein [Thiolapillus brandeum]